MIDLFYKNALTWMWNYCIPLGKFTCSEGYDYDLGVFIHPDGKISNATVYGNTPGHYVSGEIYPELIFKNEITKEVLKRAKKCKLL
jgi:hypothetical protein